MATPGTNANAKQFLLPDLGEGLEDAELLEWCVEEGQSVEEFDTLAKMETAKALVEVPAPRGGTIEKLHGKAGDVIKVGAPLVTWADGEGATSGGGAVDIKPEAKGEGSKQTRASERNGSHTTQDVETRRQLEMEMPDQPAADDEGEAEGAREDAGTVVGQLQKLGGVAAEEGQVLAAPAVRRLAREMGVDLTQVRGSGLGGRVTASDVREAAQTGAKKPAPSVPARREREAAPQRLPARADHDHREEAEILRRLAAPRRQPDGEDQQPTRIPFRGVRRTIANRLRTSVDKAVHFGVMDEADVTALDSLRRKLVAASGEKISLLPFVCCAVARMLSGEFGFQLARLNSTTDEENSEILQHNQVHLGIATDTPSGLMVPVLRNADGMGVIEMAREIIRLSSAARDRSILPEEMQGSTFTISNFGSYAGRFASPIINYPEVGILAVGRMRDGVVVRDGLMGVGKVLPVSLTCDHRVIDGATATLALNTVIDLLQSPGKLLPIEL